MKKISYLFVVLIFGLIIYYLFIKPSDYLVKFKSPTSTGTLFRSVQEWNFVKQSADSFHYIIKDKKPFTYLNQSIQKNNMQLQLQWNFEAINDSISRVEVGFLEKEHSLYNRLTAPFINTPFKDNAIGLIKDFKNGVDFQLKNSFKVKIEGVDTIPTINFAYIKLKDILLENKAKEMMINNHKLVNFLNENHLKKGDLPFLIVDKWDLDTNLIDFRYCFPINKNDSLPFDEHVKYDKIVNAPALKAIYNGNYKTSDRGWFALYDYAKRHNINIDCQPVEVFHNNPFNGGNELQWITEIYMPIKQ